MTTDLGPARRAETVPADGRPQANEDPAADLQTTRLLAATTVFGSRRTGTGQRIPDADEDRLTLALDALWRAYRSGAVAADEPVALTVYGELDEQMRNVLEIASPWALAWFDVRDLVALPLDLGSFVQHEGHANDRTDTASADADDGGEPSTPHHILVLTKDLRETSYNDGGAPSALESVASSGDAKAVALVLERWPTADMTRERLGDGRVLGTDLLGATDAEPWSLCERLLAASDENSAQGPHDEAAGEGQDGLPTEDATAERCLRIWTGSEAAGVVAQGAFVSPQSYESAAQARYLLVGQRTADGRILFPPRECDPFTGGAIPDTVRLSGKAVVHSATRIRSGGAPTEFLPYQDAVGAYDVVVAQLPEGPRVAALMTSDTRHLLGIADDEPLPIDTPIEAAIRLLFVEQGHRRYNFKFRPRSGT